MLNLSTPTEYLAWGSLAHLVADWLFQNEWMAKNKVKLYHPAAWVHSGIHYAAALLVFPWWGALIVFVTHILIDTRTPLVWWGNLIKQTPIANRESPDIAAPSHNECRADIASLTVAFWRDQVAHILFIGIVSILCGR